MPAQQDGVELPPDQFRIVDVYRLEGMTDPAGETVVYTIEEAGGKHGTLVSARGPYADELSSEMVERLSRSRIIG